MVRENSEPTEFCDICAQIELERLQAVLAWMERPQTDPRGAEKIYFAEGLVWIANGNGEDLSAPTLVEVVEKAIHAEDKH